MVQCAAHSKQTGLRCKQHAVGGKTVCHYHGGKTPVRHGRASKFTDTVLSDAIAKHRENKDLRSLEHRIARCEAVFDQAVPFLTEVQAALAAEDLDTAAKLVLSEKLGAACDLLSKLNAESTRAVIALQKAEAGEGGAPWGLVEALVDLAAQIAEKIESPTDRAWATKALSDFGQSRTVTQH